MAEQQHQTPHKKNQVEGKTNLGETMAYNRTQGMNLHA